jgi:hypothetical protein
MGVRKSYRQAGQGQPGIAFRVVSAGLVGKRIADRADGND